MPLTVTDCIVTNNSITITFSDPIVKKTMALGPTSWGAAPTPPPAKNSALNAANYTIYDPNSVDFQPQPVAISSFNSFPLPASTKVNLISHQSIEISSHLARARVQRNSKTVILSTLCSSISTG